MTRDITESTVVTINADSEDAAKERALEMVCNHADQFGWATDDNDPDDPYVTDCIEG